MSEEMSEKQHIVSFSGGKDSTAMLLMMLERGMQVDRVICVDTTKEFPEMYEHIAKVQEMILPLRIEVVKIDFDYWFTLHQKTRGKYKHVLGYGWPDMQRRWCTALKNMAFRHASAEIPYNTRSWANRRLMHGHIEYRGFAYDERERVHKFQNPGGELKFPLVEWGITETQALHYCYDKGLDWGGLYKKFARVSCFCCPLAKIRGLRTVYNDHPELWAQMQEMDKKSFRKFRADYSLSDLTHRFERENMQCDLDL